MSTTYTNGTVYDSGGSAATNTQTLQTTIKNAILANSAWSLVEDTNVGTAPFRWIALKCAAASSGLPNDFYVVTVAQVGGGTLNIYLCESYTSASHTIAKYAANVAGSTTYTPASDATVSTTITPAASGAPNTPTPPGANSIMTINSSVSYNLVVYSDHLVLCINSAATYSYYIGAFTSLVYNAATADPMPLVQVSLIPNTSNPASGGGSTRHPLMGGVAATFLWSIVAPVMYAGSNYFASTWASAYVYYAGNVGLGYGGADLFQNSTQPLSEALVVTFGGLQVGPKTLGYARGKYSNLRLMSGPPTGMTVGDQIVFNGTHWVCAGIATGTSGVGCFVDTGA